MSIDWPTIFEYLKVILSWPVCVTFIVIFISKSFNGPIAAWLSRLKIEYGGATLSTQQPIESPITGKLPTTSPQADPGDEFTRSLEKMSLAELKNQVIQWRSNSYIWEYQYLNIFLVYNSRRFLTWLCDLKQVNVELAEAFWRDQIPSRNEREAILTALLNHYLVELKENQIYITPKGREYIEHFGRVLTAAVIPTVIESAAKTASEREHENN